MFYAQKAIKHVSKSLHASNTFDGSSLKGRLQLELGNVVELVLKFDIATFIFRFEEFGGLDFLACCLPEKSGQRI